MQSGKNDGRGVNDYIISTSESLNSEQRSTIGVLLNRIGGCTILHKNVMRDKDEYECLIAEECKDLLIQLAGIGVISCGMKAASV